jgi:reductive dehalogenase
MADQLEREYPIPVPPVQFDQKNEVFKRARWDPEIMSWARPFHENVEYGDRPGYRRHDCALRMGAWNLEHDMACGNSLSNSRLYSWSRVSEKLKPYIEAGEIMSSSPQKNSNIIKKAARFLGADLVGICGVHPHLIYSHEYNTLAQKHYPLKLPEDHTNAIVMAVEMDYRAISHSPNAIASAATGFGYSMMAFVANSVAIFIRSLGYDAAPSGNDTALSIPLAMAASLGELGRMGLLITPQFGPRVRLCKVFTNMPLVHDTFRHFGVKKFCENCLKCARSCPSRAISYEPPTIQGVTISNHSGVLKWYIDPEKCYRFWADNRLDCTTCVYACPFNKPQGILHDGVRFVIRTMPVLNRLIAKTDDLLGYGKPKHGKEFWNITH